MSNNVIQYNIEEVFNNIEANSTFYVHKYTDSITYEELTRIYKKLILYRDNYKNQKYCSILDDMLIITFERIVFINYYIKNMGKDEFPVLVSNVSKLNQHDVDNIYKYMKDNNARFMQSINDRCRKHIENIVKNIHKALNLDIPRNTWKGILVNEQSQIYLWESNKKDLYNKKETLNYIVNISKHCFNYHIIFEGADNRETRKQLVALSDYCKGNINADELHNIHTMYNNAYIENLRNEFANIANVCIQAIEKYYNIK